LSKGFFVTGTDTNVGKTFVSGELMRLLAGAGFRIGGMKPVASGADGLAGQLRNEDAVFLQARASVELPYEWVNPYVFQQPIAPHLAALQEGVEIRLETIVAQFRKIEAEVDGVVVEGAGGWLCPVSPTLDVADLARILGLPVILVVGIRLGCINHARLTDRLIRASGVPYAGWIANDIDPQFTNRDQTVETLTEFLGQMPLGEIGFMAEFPGFDHVSNNHWNHSEILRRMLP
jgi:dethiobiotin synthetase